jgi:hypothetical protein
MLAGLVRKVLHEPLVHFFVAGLILFALGQVIRQYSGSHRIVLTPQREAELVNRYVLQFGTRPDAGTLEELIKSDVHDEILFRQGLALGLDKDDEIVRRRIIQKMQFLLEDLRVPPEPTSSQLEGYYRAHAQRYVLPARVTFTHVYFSGSGGAMNAQLRARAALGTLSAERSRAPGLGDPFPDLYDFSYYTREQVERLFGNTEFSAAVFNIPCGQWAGPFKSAYGWHLIYVQSRQEAENQPFAAVRDKVRADYLLDSQARANESAFSALAHQYTVVRN